MHGSAPECAAMRGNVVPCVFYWYPIGLVYKLNRHQIDHNVKVLSRVRSHLHVLQDLNARVRVTLVWIPDTAIFTTMILQTKEPKTQLKMLMIFHFQN